VVKGVIFAESVSTTISCRGLQDFLWKKYIDNN